MNASQSWTVDESLSGTTLAAFLRSHLPGHSWTQVRQIIAGRRVRLGDEVCLDPARRLGNGDRVELLARPTPKPREHETIRIRHLDTHLVVVEKPSSISTVRHPTEREWPARRRALHPTLEDLVPKLIAAQEKRRHKGPLPRLRIVHRLDKETSGLVVFARSVPAERGLGKQFRAHSILRRYIAIVRGEVKPRKIVTRLVRDRGDRRRGSTNQPGVGKEAVTHIETAERLGAFSLITCRLETGRTHQIRIHLAEQGHPVCGERVYNRDSHGKAHDDASKAPRLALHAAELGFTHPVSGEALYWEMRLPPDLARLVERLRKDR